MIAEALLVIVLLLKHREFAAVPNACAQVSEEEVKDAVTSVLASAADQIQSQGCAHACLPVMSCSCSKVVDARMLHAHSWPAQLLCVWWIVRLMASVVQASNQSQHAAGQGDIAAAMG